MCIRDSPKKGLPRHIMAIDRFLRSKAIGFFSTEHYFRTLADGLGLTRRARL